ncbi:hypothetical protein O4158_09295 [Gordonia amicalis]|uniref:hypothetical protein n=1 Tax=Gordonia amicalis TaxID=89053 RepID=UPI0022B5590F|nr:hypothetical protein [Gordonia amicalis]MCZ4579286.1 hypothetical protein [Gordonia amicalis]
MSAARCRGSLRRPPRHATSAFGRIRPEPHRTTTRIATLSVGPSAILSGSAAAWWHGIVDDRPETITVTAPRGRHGPPVKGVRILNRSLADADVLIRGDLRVTGIALSALEGGVELGAEVIDSVLQQRRTTGWTVLNSTWADLTERADYVASSIRQALNVAA